MQKKKKQISFIGEIPPKRNLAYMTEKELNEVLINKFIHQKQVILIGLCSNLPISDILEMDLLLKIKKVIETRGLINNNHTRGLLKIEKIEVVGYGSKCLRIEIGD